MLTKIADKLVYILCLDPVYLVFLYSICIVYAICVSNFESSISYY